MFGLGIHYLNGWAMAAADGAKKERAEWPPHPDRVFMAMAAAWFETGQDPEEKTILKWIEQLPLPEIAASDVQFRREVKSGLPVASYVPVNDTAISRNLPEKPDLAKLKDAGLSLLPEFRSRQPRRFPVAIPHHPEIHLIWRVDLPADYREALMRICQKVVSIGHSASFVQMWLTDNPPPPTLVPLEGPAQFRLRVFSPGRLDYLKSRFNRDEVILYRDALAAAKSLGKIKKDLEKERKASLKGLRGVEKKEMEASFKHKLAAIDQSIAHHQETLDKFKSQVPNSLRPEPGLWQGYGPAGKPVTTDMTQSLFDENFIVLSLSGKRPGLQTTLKLTEAVRGALLSGCPAPIPEWISGHRPDGARSFDPHLAVLPLPFVGHEHADGRIMGIGFVLPRSLDKREVGATLEPWLRDDYGLPRSIKLFDGQWLECKIEVETREAPPWNLRAETWTKPSRVWASVTPVVLDRHFDGKDKWEQAAEVVKDACERIGLPRPENVLLHPVSLVEGVPHSREFPPIKRKSDGGRMHHCHAIILFSEPVIGPVLVGAGRFRGYGLCRPMDRKEDDHD